MVASSLGIETDREGWVLAMKIHDDKVWDMIKSGKLSAFSIAGRASKETN